MVLHSVIEKSVGQRPELADSYLALLQRGCIRTKSSVGGRIIEDPLFQEFLAGLRIEQLD
jgi:hypothetical protein